MVDIPIVSFFSTEIDQGLYSAASTYGKFAFICSQFLLFFKLPEVKQASRLSEILKYAISIALLSLIPMLALSITPNGFKSLLFTEQYESVPEVALLQSFALFPYLVCLVFVQLLISKDAVRAMIFPLGLLLTYSLGFMIMQPSLAEAIVLHSILGLMFSLYLIVKARKFLKLKTFGDSVVEEVVFVVGTTAEMIKIAPVVQGIHSGQLCNLSQQRFDVWGFIPACVGRDDFVVRTRDGVGLQTGLKSLIWLFQSIRFLFIQILSNRCLGYSGRKSLTIVVHGDTLTAGLTAITSKILGVKVAHIEAGLRSHNLRHPFPEEIIRILISQFADIHFCPSEQDLLNIKKRGTRKILTNGNTFLDSFIPIADKVFSEGRNQNQIFYRKRPFVLVHLHRLEFIRRKKLVTETFLEISRLIDKFDIVLILDPHLETVLQKLRLLEGVHGSMKVLGKQTREDFTRLVCNAEFVITDSGGTQEELGYLGVPALIHRITTERSDGLGKNILLSKWQIVSIGDFARDYARLRQPCNSTISDPTGIILSVLGKQDTNEK
jgi:UDP-N-acetylglucosamine 2-epimerase (non-hydrolysing)